MTDDTVEDAGDERERDRISPSQYMRARRPEHYSDTNDRAAYALDKATFEFHLNSLTSRNETHDFEIFCRKLCERTICPHLRPHSGPEGGGDGKTDSETIPVAEEISDLFYVGDADAGQRKFAFAFSAKEKWSEKVRNDVKGIAETQRRFDRIYFVTNQAARARTVAELEQQLEREYGIPLTILDRAWIVEQVIDHERIDIAYNYLGVGQPSSDPLRLGPNDYSRTQQLTDIEKELADPAAYAGMESQRVTDALVAAKLSRNLERPRVETDGRFARAIRLAKKEGTFRQKLETQYEFLWTAVWWFDDLQLLDDSYDEFAAQAIGASHMRNLELLTNLLQLLINGVLHDHLARDECKLDARALAVQNALQAMADEADRPNNSLEAKTALILMRLNFAILDREIDKLPEIWTSLGEILDQAEGLGEFPARRLAQLIEEMGNLAGNDADYNVLVEKLAEFIGTRESEASGGLTLLKRADKLDLDEHYDIIRFAGRAAMRLTKKEHTSSLVHALQLLTMAYRHAGLLWVARASCAFVAASILIESEERHRPSISIIPTMKIWAWLSLELGHLPDALLAIQVLNGARATLPLSDETKAKVGNDLEQLDYALGALLLNASDGDLEKLRALPDLLSGLDLMTARTALLYALGQEDQLRNEGYIPPEEPRERVREMMSLLASQPVVGQSAANFIFNDGSQAISTQLLGLRVTISTDASDNALLVGELVATSLEAFFATAPDQEIIPLAANFEINVTTSDDVAKPTFEVDEFGTSGMLIWPNSIAPHSFANQSVVHNLMLDVVAKVQAHAFMTPKLEEYVKQLYAQDSVQGRMAIAIASGNSYHRVHQRFYTSLDHWSEHELTSYPRGERPTLDKADLPELESKEEALAIGKRDVGRFRVDDHRDIEVLSVIDVHAWDRAIWRGTGYLQFSSDQPPVMALLFENEQAARYIFSRWRERFGHADLGHEIHVAVIRKYDEQQPSHYIMQIASKPPSEDEFGAGQGFVMTSRCIENTPPTTEHLDLFLKRLQEHGCYGLMPAIVTPDMAGEPALLTELAIMKRYVSVKLAQEVGEYDVEGIALRQVRHRAGEADLQLEEARSE